MPVTSARGAPPLHPPGPTLQTTSDPHSAPTTTSEISTVAYTVYRDKDLSKLLVGDAPVIPPSNEMMVFTRVPPDLSIFDFVKAANQQIGPAYICRPIQSPNWASKTKDLGIVFDNKEHDQAAAMKGITVNDITYYPAINLPDNMKFRKYTVTNLPDIRRPQVNLIEPLLDLFSQYGQVARIDFIYRIKHLPDAVQFQTVRLFTNKSTIYTFIDESFDMDVQTPEPVMCLEYENRSYHVTSTWQGAKEFCKYCKQFDHSIGKCPKRLALRCKDCNVLGHVASSCARYGSKKLPPTSVTSTSPLATPTLPQPTPIPSQSNPAPSKHTCFYLRTSNRRFCNLSRPSCSFK